LCARFGDGGGSSLENIAKDWLGFLPLLRRVSQDTSCVLVHGYSSCDLGLMQLVIVVAIVYGSSKW
jgi:hypothetical protein